MTERLSLWRNRFTFYICKENISKGTCVTKKKEDFAVVVNAYI